MPEGSSLSVAFQPGERVCRTTLRNWLVAHVGCTAGAILIEEYRNRLVEAGSSQVDIVDTNRDFAASWPMFSAATT
jgi:hypothetical protein